MPEKDEEVRTNELNAAECRSLLRRATAGRVAWTAPDGPQVLPVSCLYRNGNIVFRTSPDGALAELRRRHAVAFEIDEIGTGAAWSVVVRGFAEEMHQAHDLIELWEGEGLIPWAAGRRPIFIEIIPRTITGRRFRAPAH